MRFSLTRLIVAVAVFAPALAWTRHLGSTRMIVAMLIATPIALIVLLVKRSDVRHTFRCLVGIGIGIAGSSFCFFGLPRITSGYPEEATDQYLYMIAGASIGGFVASVIGRWNETRPGPQSP